MHLGRMLLPLVTLAACAPAPPTFPDHHRDNCSRFDLDARRVWSADSADELRASFATISVQHTRQTVETVITGMDHFTRDWVMLSEQACHDLESGGSRPLWEAKRECFDFWLMSARSVTLMLREPDARLADRAAHQILDLRRQVRDCMSTASARQSPNGTHSPSSQSIHAMLANAAVSRQLGRPEVALQIASDAVDAARAASDASLEAQATLERGLCATALGQFDTAQTNLDHAKALFEERGDPLVSSALSALGDLARQQHQLPRALELFRAVAQHDAQQLPGDSVALVEDRREIAATLRAMNDHTTALAEFQNVLDTDRRVLRPDDPQLADDMADVGIELRALDRLDASLDQLAHAVELSERILGPDHPDATRNLTELDALLEAIHRHATLPDAMVPVSAWLTAVLGAQHPAVARALWRAAAKLQSAGRRAEAADLLRRALAIYQARTPPNTQWVPQAEADLRAITGS